MMMTAGAWILSLFSFLSTGSEQQSDLPLRREPTPAPPPDLQGIQHIIWDWNGTLLDDVQLCLKIINNILERRSLTTITLAEYREVFGFPVRDYYLRLGFDFSHEPFESISTMFITEYEDRRHSCRLMAGASQVLAGISGMGITQSILSASKRTYLRQALKEYQIDQHFIAVEGLDNHHAAGKSELAEQHLRSLPYPAESIMLVGDTLHDAEIALEHDLRCCVIPNGHHNLEKFSHLSCLTLTSLSELLERMTGL